MDFVVLGEFLRLKKAPFGIIMKMHHYVVEFKSLKMPPIARK